MAQSLSASWVLGVGSSHFCLAPSQNLPTWERLCILEEIFKDTEKENHTGWDEKFKQVLWQLQDYQEAKEHPQAQVVNIEMDELYENSIPLLPIHQKLTAASPSPRFFASSSSSDPSNCIYTVSVFSQFQTRVKLDSVFSRAGYMAEW
ncbi:uncharacterized protein PAC_03983 [Phialocephala subalpina]|uniref:Uncharacterized protein n=1 Tax=Phialocephala subalpina TaxID=576137 RepID=A0A1L7WMV7_9HELO|nr:uncharacterized protein PAC_03983 [Phialocephala subalpina]